VIAEPFLVPIVAIACAPIIAIGVPIARAWARRIEAQGQQPRVPSEVVARLERMEQAIDAIAVEIERVSEAQRFTTRLLADQGVRPAALPQDVNVGAPEGANVR
jgi:hypothetical protein